MTAPTIHICPVCGEDDGLDEQECRRCGARLWDNDEDDRPPKGGAALKRPTVVGPSPDHGSSGRR